ncbi:hypothetical protein ACFWUP_12890 [Nocardia sp. NPDC058658]|uniref:DUF7668 domain-containing protein n=1 Tax=Nocardia sp. NPDC058658 TaxID=3346580 RepID=UPI00365AA9A0
MSTSNQHGELRLTSECSLLPVKDEIQRPVADVWRPVFRSIVRALARDELQLIGEIDSVEPISDDLAAHIRGSIDAYGATLIELPDQTWESSCTMWRGGGSWEVLVDLWTAEEGRSDLCLHVDVHETDPGFRFKVHLVYTP